MSMTAEGGGSAVNLIVGLLPKIIEGRERYLGLH